MNEDMKKYWEQKLLESIDQDPAFLFKSAYPVTWKQRWHNRFLELVDRIYERITGHDPNEE